MHIIGMIVFGLVIGILARFLMPGRQPMGIILTAILGIAGSFLGGWMGTLLDGRPLGESSPAGWIGSLLGACLILFLFGMYQKRSGV
jgi:uncharacterized membrane protein YeaQ/YmgE (transglycosylase-associated protein family)